MAALIEVSDLHEHIGDDERFQQTDGATVHASEDDEGLGRSYVCSMSSAVDLECPADGNCADLTLNVQRYLSCIVEELHLISAWSSGINQHQRTAASPISTEGNKQSDDSSLTAMARLAVVTDIALMRRDVVKAHHELFQRCSTQLACAQRETNSAISKQNTLYNELKQWMNNKQLAWEQQAQSIQALEKTRAESDAQICAMPSILRHVQQQISTHAARISALEKSLATVSTAQFAHEQELQRLQGRMESLETAHHLQLEATRHVAEESLTRLRSAHSQLSAKMQVLRLEIQELSDSTQQRMQQLLKAVSSVVASASGKQLVLPAAAVAPRRPSVSPRTPRSGDNTAPSHRSHTPGTDASSASLNDFLGSCDSAQTIMTTGADAVATTDCFIYTKAALPNRNSIGETSTTTKKPVASSVCSSRGVTSSPGIKLAKEAKTHDNMTNLLTIQQSVMSVALGYEDTTRPSTATEPPKDNTNSTDQSASLIPTKVHGSLPDVNLFGIQGPLTPPKFQASCLYTKLTR